MTAALSNADGGPLRIAVDTKNLALFTGGIAGFFAPVLDRWIKRKPECRFVLIGPKPLRPIAPLASNVERHTIRWPSALPRLMRHPFYDNVLFPKAARLVRPDLIFTPYHDVRLPLDTPSVMMVHDTCLHDLPEVYPVQIRGYYLHMLKRNLKVARHTLTVSNTSRAQVQQRYGISDNRIGVVPNAMDPALARSGSALGAAACLRQMRGPGLDLFYPGGSEHRKNIARLAQAIAALSAAGTNPRLWITGTRDHGWKAAIAALADRGSSEDRFRFLGRLDIAAIAAEYLACDAVVYPTLCEGFGRVALEAMQLGVPLACSDIAVLREVADGYPSYFDPHDVQSMVAAIQRAANSNREPEHRDSYSPDNVSATFIGQMDAIIAEVLGAQ